MGSRRNFFGNLGLFLTSTFLGGSAKALPVAGGFSGPEASSAGIQASPARPLDKKALLLIEESISEEYDLVVVGGGISGVSAAVSAARNGMKVALVHNRAMFGGNSSSEVKLFPENNSGCKPWIREGGIHEEFHTEERVRNHAAYKEGTMNAHWDLVLYEWVIREKNITPYLNTHMHKVFMKNDAQIASVYAIQLGTEKTFTLSAPLFVDASGDGILGGLAGAEHRWGREAKQEYGEPLAPEKADEQLMGNTLFFQAKETDGPVPFKRPEWAAEFNGEEDLVSRGHSYIDGGYWWIEVGTPYHPIKDNNETRHEGLRQLLGVWDHIKNKCSKENREKVKNYGLEFVGFWPYKRESRRVIGDYVITQQHVQDPQLLPDAVAYGCWHIDIHVSGGILARDKEPYPPAGRNENWQDLLTMVYGIPIRSLYSRNVGNLLTAGRPISTSYLAFASTRVLSTGSICGEAIGVVAALAKRYKQLPREIAKSHASEVQQVILRQDGHIPGVENTDEQDLARKARVTADSDMILHFPDTNGEFELAMPHAQLFPISSGEIAEVSLLMRAEGSPRKVRLGLREAAHVWDFRNQRDLAVAEATVPAGTEDWVSFRLDAKVDPGKLYYVYTDKQPGVFWRSFKETDGQPNQVPIGTTPACLPDKTSYSEKSTTFREIYSEVTLNDIPGAGKEGHWKQLTMGRSLCIRLSPESRPFAASNVNRGANRPDKWSNIWISDPEKGFPASMQLEWDTPVEFNTVQLTFDTDQNRRVTLPLFRYPDCVKDYIVEYDSGAGWKTLTEVADNYVRRRVHVTDRVKASRLRVTVTATNGAASARIYEIRVYNDNDQA